MSITVNELRDTSAFQKYSPQEQQAIERQFTQNAWEARTNDDAYIAGGDQSRAKIREDFDAEFPMGASLHVEEDNRDNSFIKNMGQQVAQGARGTFDALRTFDDATAGIVDPDLAGRIARSAERRGISYSPLALKEANAAIALESKRWSSAEGFVEKAAAAGHTAFATARELLTNPEGVAYLTAQSAANMIPAMAGTIAGAATAGPVGAAAGAFSGSFATETGAYFIGEIEEEVYRRGLEPTEENIQTILNDEEFVNEASRKAKLKGAGTAGVDTLLSMGVGQLGAKAARTGERAAIRSARESLKAGLRKGRVFAAEVASEPISEAAGQLAAEGEVDAGELMGETLGGIGAAGPGAAVNVAAFGGEAAKEAKALVKANKLKKMSSEQAMLKAPAAADYKAKVSAAVEKGEVGKVADPKSPEFSPLEAMETVQKIAAKPETTPIDQVKLHNEAKVVADELSKRLTTATKKLMAFPPKEERTPEQQADRKALFTKTKALNTLLDEVGPLMDSIQSTKEITKDQIAEVHEKLKSTDHAKVTEGIMAMFGSKQAGSIDLSVLEGTTGQSPETTNLLNKVKSFQRAAIKLSDIASSGSIKATKGVHTDVIDGGEGFKGINQYTQSIAVALQAGDRKLAKSELDNLTSFTAGHVKKAEVFQEMFDTARIGEGFPKSLLDRMEKYNIERQEIGGKSYTFGPAAEGFVQATQYEAEVLTEASNMMEALIYPSKGVAVKAKPVTATTDTEVSFSLPPEYVTALEKAEFTEKEIASMSLKDAIELTGIKPVKETVDDQSQKEESGKEGKDDSKPSEPVEGQQDSKSTGTEDKEEPTPSGEKPVDGEPGSQDKKEAVVPVAKVLTEDVEGDIDNPIRNTYEPKKKLKGLLQETDNVTDSLHPEAVKHFFDETQPLDADAEAVLISLNAFSNDFQDAATKEFKAYPAHLTQLRRVDPMQYLTTDGVLNDNVVAAMMAVSYKWLGSRAKETLSNDIKTIQKILTLKEDQAPGSLAEDLITDKGIPSTFLQEALGKDIFNLLGIQTTGETDFNSQNRLEIALGLQAIATMQSMGLIKQTNVRTGLTEGSAVGSVEGMAGLINSIKETEWSGVSDVLRKTFNVPMVTKTNKQGETYLTPDPNVITGSGMTTFYKVTPGDTKYTMNDTAEDIAEVLSKSKNTWDRVFTGANDIQGIIWDKPKKAKSPQTMKGTTFDISQEQQDNMDSHFDRPRGVSHRTMGAYLLLGQKNLDRIQGVKDLNKIHVDNLKGAEGINLGIQRTNEAIQSALYEMDKRPQGYNSDFFVREETWRQGRMGETGPVNMQGNKDMRFLFNFKEWNIEMSLKDPDMHDQFMEAVALGLDLEVSKKGGLKKTIALAEKKLAEPVMMKAVAAMRVILKEHGSLNELLPGELEMVKDSYTKEMDAVTDGVIEGEMGMHTLKTIVEYARYTMALAAGDSSFTTDLIGEIDGVSNGPTIARFQLSGVLMNMGETLTALQNAGAAFYKAMPGLAEHLDDALAHDAYQVTGFAWAGKLLAAEKKLIEEVKRLQGTAMGKHDTLELKQLQGMKNLFGKFRNEKGNVSAAVRGLAKDPTMTTIYGRGLPALIKGTAEAFLNDINGKIEKAVQLGASEDLKVRAEGKDALRELNKNLHLVLGRYVFPKEAFNSDDTINASLVLSTKLEDKEKQIITDHITKYHGAALGDAITDIYGDLKDSTKALNTGINLSAGLYNVSLKMLLKQKREEIGYNEVTRKSKGKPDRIELVPKRELSIAEVTTIEEQLRPLYPHIVTYFDEKLPLAKSNKEKDYTGGSSSTREVVQKYETTATADGIAQKKAASFSLSGLMPPGVAGVILAIHNMDSTVANILMGKFPALNNHDGFTGPVGMLREFGKNTNETFYNLMKDYDLGVRLHDAAADVRKEFNLIAPSISKDPEFAKEMVKSLAEVGIKFINIPDGKIKVNEGNFRAAIAQTMVNMYDTAQAVKANKDIMVAGMVKMEQYSIPGGQYNIPTAPKPIVHDGVTFAPNQITAEAHARLNAAIKESDTDEKTIKAINDSMVAEAKANQQPVQLGSKATMELDPKDFADAQKINSMNVEQVYEQIKDDSTISDSPEHDTRLKGLLSKLVQGAMNPLDLFLKQNPEMEPEGTFVHSGSKKDKIFISSQNAIIGPVSGALGQGIRMSTGEVYVHELLHAVLHTGMSMNKKIYAQVEEMFKLAEAQLDYTAFMTDPASTDKYEIEAAKERFDYVFRNIESHKTSEFYTGTDVKAGERSNYLDEFMVLGLSNENFVKALEGVSLNRATRVSSKIAEFRAMSFTEAMTAILDSIFDIISNGFTVFTQGNVADQLESLAVQLVKKDSEIKGRVLDGVRKTRTWSNAVSDAGNTYIKKAVHSTPVLGTAAKLKDTVAYVKGTNNPLGQHMRNVELAYQRLDQGLLKSVVTEIQGRTKRLEWVYELLSKRQLTLDAAKTDETANYIKMAKGLFNRVLTAAESTGVTKVFLKTDLSSLMDYMDLSDVKSLVQNKKKLIGKIASLQKELQSDKVLGPHAEYYKNCADALGYFMVHARTREGQIPFQSTRVIAALRNTTNANTLSEQQVDRAEAYIEQLATLQALKYTDTKYKTAISALMDDDMGSFNGVMNMHKTLKADSLAGAFGGNKMKFIKGYTKQILNPRIGYKIGTIEDAAAFAREGYIMQPKAMQRDDADPTKTTEFFVFTSKNGRVNDLLTSVASYTSNAAKGTPSSKISQQMNQNTRTGILNNDRIKAMKQMVIADMANPNTTASLADGNFMVPQVDDAGDITQYRYMMTESTKDGHLEQISDFAEILGSMAGQVIDKVQSPKINGELIKGLYKQYVADYQDNPKSFVAIGPQSSDPKLAEIFNMLTPSMRMDIQQTFGGNTLYVSKDMVDISFGYRHYSIIEAFSKEPAERASLEKLMVNISSKIFKDEAKVVRTLSNIEDLMVWMTKTAKSNIIIKTLHVTWGNLGSNLMYLKSKGIPTNVILKKAWEAYKFGTKYGKDNMDLNQAKLELRMAQQDKKSTYAAKQLIRARINKLENAIDRNPVTISILSGLMPSLIDDVETVTGGENFPHGIQKKIDENVAKLPTPIQNVGKVFFLAEDTRIFKELNNAVKMTDFIGRHVLYNHYVKNGMDHKKAVASVEDEFVNFNAPTHKMIEYGNKVGLLWFTKYGSRVLKVIKDSAVDKPFDVFMAYMMSTQLGLDNILNSIPGVTKDLFAPLGNPFDSFLSSLDETITSSPFFK